MKTVINLLLVLTLAIAPVTAKITLPPDQEFQLDNGLTVKVISRPGLPLLSIRMIFKAGSALDPAGQEGLANLCSEMLMRGTTSRSAKQIAEEIAFGGGHLYNFCDREMSGFAGEFLSENAGDGVAIMADLVLNSLFSDVEIEKTQARLIADLGAEVDDPMTVAETKFFEAILAGHPFAHNPRGNIAALEKLSRPALLDFFHKHYSPGNCLLVFCGDVDLQTVRQWMGKYFNGWKSGSSPAVTTVGFPKTLNAGIFVWDKPDAPQTQIRMGGAGLAMGHPDYVPFTVAQLIYGGGFTSRLMNEIRVNRGLSYGVRFSNFSRASGGVVYAATFTKNQSVGEVIDIILAEAERMRTEPVPDSELVGAIKNLSGLYPLDFETNDDIARIYSQIWFYGLDKSYFEDYQEDLKTATAESVQSIAQRYFPRLGQSLVLIGKADEIKDQLAKFGQVTIAPLKTD